MRQIPKPSQPLRASRTVCPSARDDGEMDVQLLVVNDCPNERPAATLLRRVLDEISLSQVQVITRVVHDEQEAARLRFLGSPTVLINGRDPFVEPGQAPGLTCRLYRDASGVSGVPPVEPLRQALEQAAASRPAGDDRR